LLCPNVRLWMNDDRSGWTTLRIVLCAQQRDLCRLDKLSD
jgi:hypothetical protein